MSTVSCTFGGANGDALTLQNAAHAVARTLAEAFAGRFTFAEPPLSWVNGERVLTLETEEPEELSLAVLAIHCPEGVQSPVCGLSVEVSQPPVVEPSVATAAVEAAPAEVGSADVSATTETTAAPSPKQGRRKATA